MLALESHFAWYNRGPTLLREKGDAMNAVWVLASLALVACARAPITFVDRATGERVVCPAPLGTYVYATKFTQE